MLQPRVTVEPNWACWTTVPVTNSIQKAAMTKTPGKHKALQHQILIHYYSLSHVSLFLLVYFVNMLHSLHSDDCQTKTVLLHST